MDLPQALEDEYDGWVSRKVMYVLIISSKVIHALAFSWRWKKYWKVNAEDNSFYFSLPCRRDFTAYADVCFREFGDRVKYWTTVNEPNVFAQGGYDAGMCPPLRCSPPFGLTKCPKGNSTIEPYLVVHHSLLAHASAARLYKTKYKVCHLLSFEW